MQSVSNILENGVFNVFIKNENRHELEALAGTIGIQNGPLILCYGPTKVFPRTELTQYQSSSTKRLTESDQELLNEIFHLEDDNTNWPQEFAQVFQDLQALPMGKAMIRRILGIHRQCPSLPKVYFCNKDSEGPQIVWPGYTNTSAKNVLCNSSLITNMVNLPHAEINLTWDSTKKEFLWNEYIMPIQEVTRKLGFVTCKVPPVLLLAHELGHYLNKIESIYRTLQIKSIFQSIVALTQNNLTWWRTNSELAIQ